MKRMILQAVMYAVGAFLAALLFTLVAGCGLNAGGLNVNAGDATADGSVVWDGTIDNAVTPDATPPPDGNVVDTETDCNPTECLNANCTPVRINRTRSGSACHPAMCDDTGAVPPSYCDGKGECVVWREVSCAGLGGHCVGGLCVGMFGENLLGNGMIDGGVQ